MNVVSFPGGPRPAPGTPRPPDVALVAACAEGDREALGLLFDRHHRDVFRFVSRLAGPAFTEVDDVVQATFLTAFRAAGAFRGGAQVRTWLFGIAAQVLRHHRRSLWRRLARLRGLFEQVSVEPPPAPRRPDIDFERREDLLRLQAALGRLSAAQREAFVLCDLEETPGIEAAAALGLPAGTLYRRLHEARVALRAAIARDDA